MRISLNDHVKNYFDWNGGGRLSVVAVSDGRYQANRINHDKSARTAIDNNPIVALERVLEIGDWEKNKGKGSNDPKPVQSLITMPSGHPALPDTMDQTMDFIRDAGWTLAFLGQVGTHWRAKLWRADSSAQEGGMSLSPLGALHSAIQCTLEPQKMVAPEAKTDDDDPLGDLPVVKKAPKRKFDDLEDVLG